MRACVPQKVTKIPPKARKINHTLEKCESVNAKTSARVRTRACVRAYYSLLTTHYYHPYYPYYLYYSYYSYYSYDPYHPFYTVRACVCALRRAMCAALRAALRAVRSITCCANF